MLSTITLVEASSISRVVVSPDGKYLYVAGSDASTADNTIFVLSTRDYSLSRSIPLSDTSTRMYMAISDDGQSIYLTTTGHRSALFM